MIEKLDLNKRYSFGTLDWLEHRNEPSAAKLIEKKVNELIDTVNSIVSVQEKLIDSRFVVETKHEEPADPYAEQRKWIGCLCRFWFDNKKTSRIGILGDIDEDEIHPYFNAGLGHSYKCCEPVKPDDDIIYKGE